MTVATLISGASYSSSIIRFKERTDIGSIEQCFNPEIPSITDAQRSQISLSDECRVTIKQVIIKASSASDNEIDEVSDADENRVYYDVCQSLYEQLRRPSLPKHFRYGFEKSGERAQAIHDSLTKFERLPYVSEHLQVEEAAYMRGADEEKFREINWADANQITQETVCTIGRICSTEPGAKLTDCTMALEMSRGLSWSRRCPLNISALESWAFYPGQIIAVEGTNPMGDVFNVSKLLPVNLKISVQTLFLHHSRTYVSNLCIYIDA